MIKEYGIKDWNSFIQTICEIANHQEYRMWYRGQADYEWGLIPSVQRPEYHKKGNEQYMATNFMIYTMRLNGAVSYTHLKDKTKYIEELKQTAAKKTA